MPKPVMPTRRVARLFAAPTMLAAAAGLVVATSTSVAAQTPNDGPSAAPPALAAQGGCPGSVSARKFTSKKKLEQLTTKFNSYGPRIMGSEAHNKAIKWLESETGKIDGVRLRSQRYGVYGWYPGTKFKKGPGLDIGAAGSLSATRPNGSTVALANAGAVRFSKPTSKSGQSGGLVYLAPGQDISSANAAGKIVIRDYSPGTIPFGALKSLVGLNLSSDLAGYTDYTRPYIDTHEKDLIAAGRAGAAGVVFAFDVPGKQVRGYYDPHTGTIYRVPAVFVGSAEAAQLKALAAQGGSARVGVNAKLVRKRTRNVVATLPGRSSEKIVLAANTDGNSWVQENGVVGMLAFARYYAGLPKRCRPRTLEVVYGSSHDATIKDGIDRYVKTANKSKIAFAFAMEHLGTREILPVGQPGNKRLVFTGRPDPALFGAGDSDALRKTAVRVAKQRKLPRTAVLKGLGVPNEAQAPSICSMGGLGSPFHKALVPTLAMISGPWSLYDPVFGKKALDFGQMRKQVLAAGDAVLALDGLSTAKIAGDYPALKKARDQGTKKGCTDAPEPQFAPGPGQ